MSSLTTILRSIGIPANARRVYETLATKGKASARTISDVLGLPRPSVYDQLALLERKGLVRVLDEGNKKMFHLADPREIERLLDERLAELAESKKSARKVIGELHKKKTGAEPRVKFYAGTEGYRQVLTDILMFPNHEMCALWPYDEMTRVAGDDYLRLFTERRVERNIRARVVWPSVTRAKKMSIPLEQTRIAPKGMNFDMGYAIYDDRVSFISSRDESFGFTVGSQDFADLMRAQFEIVWQASKKVT